MNDFRMTESEQELITLSKMLCDWWMISQCFVKDGLSKDQLSYIVDNARKNLFKFYCTETHTDHVPRGVSTLAGECENRPTESEYIAFFNERLTETRNHEKT